MPDTRRCISRRDRKLRKPSLPEIRNETGGNRRNWERCMSLFDMKGKVAVITGSTRGIGRAIAERMAEHGAKVVISSRKADVCDQVAKEINDKYGKGTAVAIAANLSSKENPQNLIDE